MMCGSMRNTFFDVKTLLLLGGVCVVVYLIPRNLKAKGNIPENKDALFSQEYKSAHVRMLGKQGQRHEVDFKINDDLPPCGLVCQYNISIKTGSNELFTEISKNIDCPNIMGRMAYTKYKVEYPPPKSPPLELYNDFTQYGKMPFGKNWYIIDSKPGVDATHRKYDESHFEKYISDYKKNISGNVYHCSDKCVLHTIKKYRGYIRGKSTFVVGTQAPWIEGMFLAENASLVTTLEYGKLTLDHPMLRVITPYDFGKRYLSQTTPELYDFGASFSSLEHAGLGRYTDPLNPYGDLEAMAQVWCYLKPGGIFILGLPSTRKEIGTIEFNAHRKYGYARFQQMAANFKVLEYRMCARPCTDIILVLQKLS